MNPLIFIAVRVVAILHILSLILQMFSWNHALGRKLFGLNKEFASRSATLAANQELYNGLFGLYLLWGIFKREPNLDFVSLQPGCIAAARSYGGWKFAISIFWVPAMPAIVSLLLIQFMPSNAGWEQHEDTATCITKELAAKKGVRCG